MPRTLDPFQFLLVVIAGWMNQRQLQGIEYLREENRVLREQLGEHRLRFNDDQRRRLVVRAKGLGRKLLAEVARLVTPDTLLTWHRKLIAQKYDGHDRRSPGRPRIREELEDLVVRMAEENRIWGYRRIQGAMSNLGYKVAHSSIAAILRRHGIEPAPERSRKGTWKQVSTLEETEVLLPLWAVLGHNILYIVVGFIWLSFASPGPPGEKDITVREDSPQRYEFAAMLCFLLFAHNLLERIEGAGGQRRWLWLGTGQWQLLLVLGLLSLMFQLFFWSEVVEVNHRSTRGSE